MSNIDVSQGSGKTVSTETISSVEYQRIKIVGGETGSTSVLGITPDGSMKVSVIGTINVSQTNNSSVSGTVGASVIGTVPVTQSGSWSASIMGGPVTIYAPVTSLVSGITSIVTSTSQTSVLATAPGGQRNYITHILVTNAASVGSFVDIMDGPNVIYSGFAAAGGGGFASSFPAPLRQSNTVLSVDMKAGTQASIKTAIVGFTAP